MAKNELLLILPAFNRSLEKKIVPFWMPPLGLATIAGDVPDDWNVRIIDENVDELNPELENADIVAISAMTANANRGYQIADIFRNRGIKVILGGAHPSVYQEEARTHADTVLIGDAEGVFRSVLLDFERKKMKGTYQRKCTVDNMQVFNTPRRELYSKGKYLSVNTMQTSRGCPHNCSFCSIAARYHRRYGVKPLEQVFREIENLENKDDPVFFVDDNIFVNRKRTEELLKGLRKFGIKWWSQTDIRTVQDDSFLDLAKESGCINLVLGFESISKKAIDQLAKHQNAGYSYSQTIEKLHRHGIFANPSFTFGLDTDTEDVFQETYDFLVQNGAMFATFNILTPLPGTELFHSMMQENRIIDTDWSHYDMGHVVFNPAQMSPQKLKEGYNWICRKFYSMEDIYKRVKPIRGKDFNLDINLVIGWNLGYKRMIDTFGVLM